MAAREFLPRTIYLFLWLSLVTVLCASRAVEGNTQFYPPDAPQQTIPLKVCASGASTLLLSGGISRSHHHNGDQGKVDFILEDKASGAVLWKDRYVGEGLCLGFNAVRRNYVIGIRKEHGIGVRLTDVRYLEESEHKIRNSAFNKRHIEAFSAVPSPDLHYIAFIGMEGNDISLFVLDTEKDALKRVGKAPLPPPFTPEERSYVKAHPDVLQEGPWGWMGAFRDGYMQLDPGIVEFEDNDVLRVRYGADTPYERSPQRRVVRWQPGQL
jgi:hypothetical protein